MESGLSLSSIAGNYHECRPKFLLEKDAVVCSTGSTIHVVSSTVGELLGNFTEHRHPVTDMVQIIDSGSSKSKRNRYILSSDSGGIIHLWDVATCKSVYSTDVEVPVLSMMLAPGSVMNVHALTLSASMIQAQEEAAILANKSKRNAKNGLQMQQQQPEKDNNNTAMSGAQYEVIITIRNDAPVSGLDAHQEGTGGASESSFANTNEGFKVVAYNLRNQMIKRVMGLVQQARHCATFMSFAPRQHQDDIQLDKASGMLVSAAPEVTYLMIAQKQAVTGVLVNVGGRKGDNGAAAKAPTTIHLSTRKRGPITCLCANSSKGMLAVGHATGELSLWHNLFELVESSNSSGNSKNSNALVNGKRSHGSVAQFSKQKHTFQSYSTLHWHSNRVETICFSGDGLQLFSGADEGVLVCWDTASSAAGTKSFFPRVGSSITHIVVSDSADYDASGRLITYRRPSSSGGAMTAALMVGGTKVIVTTADNCLRSISIASMTEDWHLRGICLASRADTVYHRTARKRSVPVAADTSMGVVVSQQKTTGPSIVHYKMLQSDLAWTSRVEVEPRTGYLLCNGFPGQLQACDPATGSFCCGYQIVQYTRISKKEVFSKVFVPSIVQYKCLSVPGFGDTMVTLDVRKGEEIESETSLKFWEYSVVDAGYRLNAQMDSPHGHMRVLDVALCVDRSESRKSAGVAPSVMCATCAVDGSVKLWRGTVHVSVSVSSGQPKKFHQRQAQQQQEEEQQQQQIGHRHTKWTCVCSFTYRECPASSVTFSRDGTLLVVAHQNLVTLWDPFSLKQRATIVASAANNVIFTSIIEPCASNLLGRGAGSAYLILGTKRSVSVVDLLRLTTVWSKSGRFSAFSVASNEAQCISTAQGGAWIAAVERRRRRAGSGGGGFEGEEDEDDDEEEEDENESLTFTNATALGEQQQALSRINLFGLESSAPFATHSVPAIVNATAFVVPASFEYDSSSIAPSTPSASLAITTENCELLMLRPAISSRNVDSSSAAETATEKPSALRQLRPTAELESDAASKNSRVVAHLAMQQQAADNGLRITPTDGALKVNKFAGPGDPAIASDWLESIFDRSTENVQSLSVLCGSYMGSLLRPTNDEFPHLASSTNAAKTAPSAADAASKIKSNISSIDTGLAASFHSAPRSASTKAAGSYFVNIDFDALENECDQSLVGVFSSIGNSGGDTDRAAYAASTSPAIKANRERTESTASNFSGTSTSNSKNSKSVVNEATLAGAAQDEEGTSHASGKKKNRKSRGVSEDSAAAVSTSVVSSASKSKPPIHSHVDANVTTLSASTEVPATAVRRSSRARSASNMSDVSVDGGDSVVSESSVSTAAAAALSTTPAAAARTRRARSDSNASLDGSVTSTGSRRSSRLSSTAAAAPVSSVTKSAVKRSLSAVAEEESDDSDLSAEEEEEEVFQGKNMKSAGSARKSARKK